MSATNPPPRKQPNWLLPVFLMLAFLTVLFGLLFTQVVRAPGALSESERTQTRAALEATLDVLSTEASGWLTRTAQAALPRVTETATTMLTPEPTDVEQTAQATEPSILLDVQADFGGDATGGDAVIVDIFTDPEVDLTGVTFRVEIVATANDTTLRNVNAPAERDARIVIPLAGLTPQDIFVRVTALGADGAVLGELTTQVGDVANAGGDEDTPTPSSPQGVLTREGTRPVATSEPIVPATVDITGTAQQATLIAELTQFPLSPVPETPTGAVRTGAAETGTPPAVTATPSTTATLAPTQATAVLLTPTLSFEVIDRSGAKIGEGEVRLYAPTQMTLEEAGEILVEIEVKILETPPGATAQPSPSRLPAFTNTPRLGTPRPTNTPLPLIDIRFAEIRQRMGIRLDGLDSPNFIIDAVQTTGERFIRPNAINWWKWNIRPRSEAAVGTNQLRVVVYLPGVVADSGEPYLTEVDVIPFSIVVTRVGALPNAGIIALAVVAGLLVLGLLVVGARLVQTRSQRKVFLSYRRAESSQLVQTLAEKLRKYNVDAFFDTREISGAGHFPDRLRKAIEEGEVFVCLLGATTLDSEWVQREIEMAHKLGKPMIPIFQESYRPTTGQQPPYIDALLNFDGLPILDVRNVFIDDTVEKLAEMIHKTPRKAR